MQETLRVWLAQAQGSRIIMNAHRINKGEMPDLRGGRDSDFFFAAKETNEEVVDLLVRYCTKNLPSYYHVRLMIADQSGGSLGPLSFAEDELYYCLFPYMSAHMAQVRLTVKNVQRNKGKYLRHAKAEIEFLIRLNQDAENYRNPNMNERIERILSDYRNQLRGTAYTGRL